MSFENKETCFSHMSLFALSNRLNVFNLDLRKSYLNEINDTYDHLHNWRNFARIFNGRDN